MMLPFNTDLMKHTAIADAVPTVHERKAARSQRKARDRALRAFLGSVFARVRRLYSVGKAFAH